MDASSRSAPNPKPPYRFAGTVPRALAYLRSQPRWVAWNYERKGDHWTKLPIDPRIGRLASVSDPATWGTFEEALARMESQDLAGVGLVLTAQDDLIGIDLDDCISAGGTSSDLAAEVVGYSETYAEVSPSGQGVRLFARGKAAKAVKDTANGIEIYNTGRYLTVTGQQIPDTPDCIGAAPRTLARLTAVAEAARAAKKGKSTGNGDARAHGRNFFRSVNDAAFARLDDWVPALLPQAVKQATGAWRVTSKALGRDYEEDLSIHPSGIADFGSENGLTPIDLVIQYGDAPDATAAAIWLCERMRIDPSTLGWNREARSNGQAQEPKEGDAATTDTRPRLLVEATSPEQTVGTLRDVLAAAGVLYDRGVPVRLVADLQHGTVADVMRPDGLVLMTHRLCRPYAIKQGEEVNVCLPRKFAVMYLEMRGDWHLPPLNGITTAPLLRHDGTIISSKGYDPASGMWCEKVPDLAGQVPERPSKEEAAAALRSIRDAFKTFCFADAQTVPDPEMGLAVVDVTQPPRQDESGFLAALVTAVCRASLPLAPGLLVTGAAFSGAGTGKGLLSRCICALAHRQMPHAVTGGGTTEELEKRIAAELMQGGSTLFLDNLNNTALKSDLLASVLTENPVRVRILGKSEMVTLNSSALVILTGNGLTVSEDLSRRFTVVELDARMEDPETRPFKTDIIAEVLARRTELLAAVLTIWRWGRGAPDLKPGLPLGSFGQWSRWVRDPLVALGCQDVATRVGETKEHDTRRQDVADTFLTWWDKHRGRPVTARNLDFAITQALDPAASISRFACKSWSGHAWLASCSRGSSPRGRGVQLPTR